MRCLCERDCFLNWEGVTRFYSRDQIVEFEECPPHFISLDEEIQKDPAPNFEEDSEEILMEKKWKASELIEFMSKRYGVEVRPAKKSEMISKLMYARDNAIAPEKLIDANT